MKMHEQRGDHDHDGRDRRVAPEHAAARDRTRETHGKRRQRDRRAEAERRTARPGGEARQRTPERRRRLPQRLPRDRTRAPAQIIAITVAASSGHIAAIAVPARTSAEGPPPTAHGTKTSAASAYARDIHGSRDRAPPVRRRRARARCISTADLRYLGSVEFLVPLRQQARALGRRAVLGEVVVDELDIGQLRRLPRASARSCSMAPGSSPWPARRSPAPLA